MKKLLLILLIFTYNLNGQTIPEITLEQIKAFINQTQSHDPNNLPSSWTLFYETKPDNLIWSILIPTLTERNDQFEQIFTKIMNQIIQANLQDQIEIVFYRDNRDATVGYKRNQLISNASGKYTCFVDDDDDVSDNYIKMIYQALLQDKDCVKLVGIYSVGNIKQLFVHSINYRTYFEANRVFYRPPNHLNPIKRTITSQFKFNDHKNYGEDTDWAMLICQASTIKSEALISQPYYFYNFNPQKSVSSQRIN